MADHSDRYLELDEVQAAFLRSLIAERMPVAGFHSQTALQTAAGVSQPFLTSLLSGRPGRRWRQKVRQLSEVLWGDPLLLEQAMVDDEVRLRARQTVSANSQGEPPLLARLEAIMDEIEDAPPGFQNAAMTRALRNLRDALDQSGPGSLGPDPEFARARVINTIASLQDWVDRFDYELAAAEGADPEDQQVEGTSNRPSPEPEPEGP